MKVPLAISEAAMDEPRKIGKAARGILLLDAMILVAATSAVLAVCRGPEWMGMLSIWGFHLVIGAVPSAPIVLLGRTRVHWSLVDLLALLLPFAVWGALCDFYSEGKSLANLGEPFFFSFAIPVAALTRVIIGAHVNERACSISLVVLLSLVAAGVYWWTPALPE
jgi:hypothetical protein